MSAVHANRSMSDRTLNRLIAALALILVVGVIAVAAIYYLDRHVDSGPSLVDRQITAAEEAVRQNPNLLSARVALAVDYLAANRWQEAVTQYSEVLKVNPSETAARMGRGQAYLKLGQLDAAKADYQAVFDAAKGTDLETSDPQVEAALYNLGSIAMQQDRAADAVPLLEQALSIDRGDADASYVLGTAYLATADPTDAIQAFQWAASFVPVGWCDPYHGLVQAYTAANEQDGVQYATGMVAYCEGRFADADAALRPLASSPTLGKYVLLGLGMVAEGQGNSTQAIDWYQQALALDPSNFNASSGLARLGVTPPPSSASPSAPPSASPADGGNG